MATQNASCLAVSFLLLIPHPVLFAQRMEDLERRAFWVAQRWLGLEGEVISTQWSRDYQIADVAVSLQILEAMQSAGFPDVAIREQMHQVASIIFAAADPETAARVQESIDEMSHEPARRPLMLDVGHDQD